MTNTKGTTMPQIDDAELFGNAEDQRAYEDFCANQEAVEKFTLDKPALICRWRMSNKKVPMLNRHIRALSERLVQGEPLTHNMLSWAKQHVEWSLAEGDYTARDGVLMLVIDVNGNAAMTVGEYEPLADTSAKALRARSAEARSEADETGVAPELLAAVNNGELAFVAPADECLCGTATLIEQLAQTKGISVARVDIPAQLKGALFLVSDEHGVVPATETDAADADAAYSAEDSSRLLHVLLTLPQGVEVMSADFPGLVQTSLNLGVMTACGDGLHFSFSIRSSVATQKELLLQRVRAIVEYTGGGTVSTRGDYPAWQYARQSPLRDTVMASYKQITGQDGVIMATHGGLECGLLINKMPGLDAVSLGPELHDIHSPRERLGVDSVKRMYALVCEVLKNCR